MRGSFLFLAGILTGFALASITFVWSPDRRLDESRVVGVSSPAVVEEAVPPSPAPPPESRDAPRISLSDRDPHRSLAHATADTPAARPPVPGSSGNERGVRGFVRDPLRGGIAGAEVSIRVGALVVGPSRHGQIDIPIPDVGRTITDSDGRYAIAFDGSGLVRVTARAAGYDEALADAVFSHGRGPPVDLFLNRTRQITSLEGRLLDLGGKPLWPADVYFIFPRLDELGSAAACAPETDTAILTIGAVPGSDPQPFPAGVSPEGASFFAQLDSGWTGLVRLVFRGRMVAEAPWKDGEPPVELRVDLSPLRARVGGIDLTVVDSTSGAFVVGSRLTLTRLDPEGEDWGECQLLGPRAPGPMRLADLPPGRYGLRVVARGYAEVLREARVEAGANSSVEVVLPRPAVLQVRLVETEGAQSEWYAAALFDAGGRQLPCDNEFESSGGAKRITVSGVPPGECRMVVATNVLRLSVAEGSRSDIVLPLRRPRTVALRLRSPSAGTSRWATVHLLAEGNIPALDQGFGGPAAEEGGWSTYYFKAVPGTYLLELRTPGGDLLRREVVVGEGESTEVVIE